MNATETEPKPFVAPNGLRVVSKFTWIDGFITGVMLAIAITTFILWAC